MLTLSAFLKTLPGIKPNSAKREILTGRFLSETEMADIHTEENRYYYTTTYYVGPEAAAAILKLYRDSRLPMNRGDVPKDAPDAEAYIASKAIREEALEVKRRKGAISDPLLVSESDLEDFDFINDAFINAIGLKSGTMTLAGIEVRKTLTTYKTNSGKNNEWHVRFDWTGSDGQHHYCENSPAAKSNRRNDPDRDWGLPD